MIDSIPIRLSPLPGEDLDSYLQTFAHRLHVDVTDILALIPAWTGNIDHGRRPWVLHLTSHDRELLADLTGLSAHTLAAMTLARYQNTGLVKPDAAPGSRPRWWLTFRGSRFCPRCLTGNGGRWMLAWRLPWTFACTHHHRLLAANCDACGRLHRPTVHRPEQEAGRCDTTGLSLPTRLRRHQPPDCTIPLADTATIALDPHGPVLAAQRHVNGLIDRLLDARDHATTDPAPAARQRLDDLHAAARAALLALTADPTPPHTVTGVLTELGIHDRDATAAARRSGADRRQPRDTALGTAIAHLMLQDKPDDPDPSITDWLNRPGSDGGLIL